MWFAVSSLKSRSQNCPIFGQCFDKIVPEMPPWIHFKMYTSAVSINTSNPQYMCVYIFALSTLKYRFFVTFFNPFCLNFPRNAVTMGPFYEPYSGADSQRFASMHVHRSITEVHRFISKCIGQLFKSKLIILLYLF